MSRRRLTLAAYLRRRWRAIGAILVLMVGSLLVVTVTDRGHDPAWQRSGAEIDQAALSPDASVVYTLLRADQNVTGLQARDGVDGELLWESPLHAPRALLAAGPLGVAVATDFPRAFLTLYHADGSPWWELPLQGSPSAIGIDGERIALALHAPGNPVLFFDGDLLIRTYHLGSPVRALDVERGLVATGGQHGEVVVFRDREEILNVTLPMEIRSLRLAHDGTAVLAGGLGVAPDAPRGLVTFLDIGTIRPIRWSQDTSEGVGLVDLDASGLVAMAVEEEPPTATVHVYEGATGATRWTRRLPGSIQSMDAGDKGGAALSPDGDVIGVATLRGDFVLFDARDGSGRWDYRAGGAGLVAFGDEEPRRVLLVARLLENRPYDSLLLFSRTAEPFVERAVLQATAVIALGAACLALLIGVGYWRAKRPY